MGATLTPGELHDLDRRLDTTVYHVRLCLVKLRLCRENDLPVLPGARALYDDYKKHLADLRGIVGELECLHEQQPATTIEGGDPTVSMT